MRTDFFPRIVEPELLDELPPYDARAVGSRGDLRRLNWIMGHAGILTRVLGQSSDRSRLLQVCELGAGDGRLMLTLARRWSAQGVKGHAVLVDRQDIVAEKTRREFAALKWSAQAAVADVFEWLESLSTPVDLIFCNLFAHHFSEDALRRLFERVSAKTELFIACEPRRTRLGLAASRMLGLIGCNEVTRHDALASVRAGFRGKELSMLWPAGGWELKEGRAGSFSHLFIAKRNG